MKPVKIANRHMSRKNIYIEAQGLVDDHFSGIGQYILGLLRGLDALIDDQIKRGEDYPRVFVLISYDKVHKYNSYNFKHLRVKRLPLSNYFTNGLWHKGLMFPLDLYFGKGYYVFTKFVKMPLLFSKYAVVVYDLSYELHRQYSEDRNANFLSNRVPPSARKADSIITISENSKKEISEVYKVPKNKIVVASPAADMDIFRRKSQSEIETIKKKYEIEGNYIISLSNLEPRKNLVSLVNGYCMLDKKYLETTSLLLVGVKGWKTDSLLEVIESRIKEGYKIILPQTYVDDTDKVALLSGALMLVYPSHYEGFGMPPLEALACGTPVLVANNSSLPEVVGDVGVLLQSNEPEGVRDAIQSELENPSNVTTLGPKHVRSYSWKASAQKVIDAALK